jgi:hypothetical protein
MGHYVSVRGWLEVDAAVLPRVKQLVQAFPSCAGESVLTPEQVRLYAQGWVLGADSHNWTTYCFYGADLRREALPCLLVQLRTLAQVVAEADARPGSGTPRYDGVFFVDDDEGELSVVWYVKSGEVIETTPTPVP